MLRPLFDVVSSEEVGAAVMSASRAAIYEVMALNGPSLLGSALLEIVTPLPSAALRAVAEAAAGRPLDADAAFAPLPPRAGGLAHLSTCPSMSYTRPPGELLQRFLWHLMHEPIVLSRFAPLVVNMGIWKYLHPGKNFDDKTHLYDLLALHVTSKVVVMAYSYTKICLHFIHIWENNIVPIIWGHALQLLVE